MASRERGCYAAAYERLRACVTGARGGPLAQGQRAAGLGLVLQQGVPGWMAADAGLCFTLPASPAASTEAPVTRLHALPHPATIGLPPKVLPQIQQPELALVIASLVLSTQRIAHAPSTGHGGVHTSDPGGMVCC